MTFDTISVVGLGYIGLPIAAILASRKKKVIGFDINQNAVDSINRGETHFVEPELDLLVHTTVTEGYLRATTTVEHADAFLITVPTPFKGDHEPDLSYIEAASKSIAPVLKKGDLVILESTSPVGTTEQMAAWLAEARSKLTFPQTHGEDSDIRIAHCPERVLTGRVIRELVETGRLIGGMTPRCAEAAANLYKIFVKADYVITTARVAEMTKLTENSFRDVNIAFANELSIICDKLDINVWELIRLANHHPRVNILQPGPGVGGHCIAVDPWFIVHKTPEEAQLIRIAREVNDSKPEIVLDSIIAHAKMLKTKQIVCLGSAFKPDIDDQRNSPALKIILKLARMGYDVQLVEPNIEALPEALAATGCQLTSLEAALEAVEERVISVLVAHKEFKASEELRLNTPLDFCGALNDTQ